MKVIVVAMLLGILSGPSVSFAQIGAFHASELTGAQMVPPTPSVASMNFTGRFSSSNECPAPEGETLFVYSNWSLGVGEPVDLRLYSGVPGENGKLEAVLLHSPNLESGREYEVSFNWPECQAWLEGGLYVVITTEDYPDGELRGQIMLDWDQPVLERSWGTVKAKWGESESP